MQRGIAIMKKTMNGKFTVKATPQPGDELTQSLGAMRMKFDKRFEGSLSGESVVSMMGILDQKIGSGGYVAIEQFKGAIDGKRGSFYLQHSCTMNRGAASQQIVVIPDTGTDQLKGLVGEMTIDIKEDGSHFYTFDYELE
jgi:hypothetical protein